MKFNAVWIINVLADKTRRAEKQKRWAKTAACGASLCTHPWPCTILRNSHLKGGGGGGNGLIAALRVFEAIQHSRAPGSAMWGVIRLTFEQLTTVGGPPPPHHQSDCCEKTRNLQQGKSGQTIFSTQIFGSQAPSPPFLSSIVSLRVVQGQRGRRCTGRGGAMAAACGTRPMRSCKSSVSNAMRLRPMPQSTRG